MKTFITEDFLLTNPTARTLYHEWASGQPILDYHCHLPVAQIADNHRFANLFEIWLAGDHYKWRAMRTNGISEQYCTGDADDREKFLAYARTVPRTLRNPLYHWTHLELLRVFGIDDLLDEASAPAIWDRANECLAGDDFRVHALLERHQVSALCTTDDPVDDLAAHYLLSSQTGLKTRVYPTFRPDKALAVERPGEWNAWVDALEATSGKDCSHFDGFLSALEQRHTFFHEQGCRLSDHGLSVCPGRFANDRQAADIFESARGGIPARAEDGEAFAGHLMLYFGRLDFRRGWTKQLHLGAIRGNNSRLLRTLGPDTGFDSIGDWSQATALSRYLDALDSGNELPQTILYNLNPADNHVFATMIGNFQDGSVPGKLQFGSGWWFLDQKDGMEAQINTLSNLGLLSRFVGMLTDSRSFLSFPRHEYFRRILCNLLGADVERGELPRDMELLGGLVRDVCHENARQYFGLEVWDGQ